MTVRIAGVDVGFTKDNPTALVVVEFGEKPVLLMHEIFLPEKRVTGWEASIDNIGKQLGESFSIWGIDGYCLRLLAYELPHVRDNAQTAIKLAHLCGIIRCIAVTNDIPVQAVQPAQGKKALTRNGSATKQQMQASARALFGVQLSEHEADACGIALAGALLAQVVA